MATLQQRLHEAQEAYHDLLIGKAARVYIDQNGERVEYVAANKDSLKAYIADLQSQITAAVSGSCEGPLRPFFL